MRRYGYTEYAMVADTDGTWCKWQDAQAINQLTDTLEKRVKELEAEVEELETEIVELRQRFC